MEDNIRFGLRFRKLPRAEVKRRIDDTLELMGIAQFASADIRTLSGGELQRVALARALAVKPEILFLDEPTSSLDVHVRRRFREDLRRVVDGLSATVVLITHKYSEALALARRVVVVQDGSIVQVGTPEEVFTRPQNVFVADFTGAETIWHATVVGCDGEVCELRTQAGAAVRAMGRGRPGEKVMVAIRPEDVILLPGADGPAGGETSHNQWRGQVCSAIPTGGLVRVTVRLDGTAGASASLGAEGEVVALVTRAEASESGLAAGSVVIATAKATALHIVTG